MLFYVCRWFGWKNQQ